MAIEGLGSRALAGRTGVEQKASDFDQLGMQVTPETVLGVYAAIASQVTRLRASMARFKASYGDGMPLLGNGHPVSPFFKQSFDDSTEKLVALCESDVDDLDAVAQGLAEAARAYGRTEREITDAFDPSKYKYVPAPTLPASLRPITERPSGPAPARTLGDVLLGGAR
jgi:hypothetical protein